MKKYSSKRTHRGKTAYRTPSSFRYSKCQKNKKAKTLAKGKDF